MLFNFSKSASPILFSGTDQTDTIIGSRFADTIFAKADDDTVKGGAGNDTIYGGLGNDTLLGEAGDDTLLGGEGNDTIYGGAGNDTIGGYKGNDKLIGGTGNDYLAGGAGNDTIYGGAGNDYLAGGSGSNLLDGGDGDDRLEGSATFYIRNEESTNNLSSLGDDVDDEGFGSCRLLGGAGNDTLTSGYGNDYLAGGTGNDVFYGNFGNDKYFGGEGNDLFYIGQEATTTDALGNSISFGGIETFVGGAGADTFSLNSGPNFYGQFSRFVDDSIADFTSEDTVSFNVFTSGLENPERIDTFFTFTASYNAGTGILGIDQFNDGTIDFGIRLLNYTGATDFPVTSTIEYDNYYTARGVFEVNAVEALV